MQQKTFNPQKPLSADRLSLLTEQEHHQYYKDVYDSQFMNFDDIVKSAPQVFEGYNLTSEDYKALTSQIICETEEELGINYDPKKIINETEQFVDANKSNILNESGGSPGDNPFIPPDVMHWTKGLGWLGALFATLLGATAFGLGKLISAGKQWLAVRKLKKYMDKIIVMADQGYSTRVGMWGKLKRFFNIGKNKKYTNMDMGSFKAQATEINRSFNGAATLLLKNMGIIDGVSFDTHGGGLYRFYINAAKPMEEN